MSAQEGGVALWSSQSIAPNPESKMTTFFPVISTEEILCVLFVIALFNSTRIVLACIALWLLYKYYNNTFNQFARQGIPGPTPIPIFGTLWTNWGKNSHDVMLEQHTKYGSVFGTYQGETPYLNVGDAVMVQGVLKDDFDNFISREHRTINSHDEFTSANLAGTPGGAHWKFMRRIIAASIAPSLIKEAITEMDAIATKLESRWRLLLNQGNIDVQRDSQCWSLELAAKLWMNTDLDVIGNPAHPFLVNAEHENDGKQDGVLSTLLHIFPQLKTFWQGPKADSGHNYLVKFVRKVLESRDYPPSALGVKKKDLIYNLAIRLSRCLNLPDSEEGNAERNKLIIPQIAGACVSMHDLGSILSRVLHCLAMNPECQDKARAEVLDAIEIHGSTDNYEIINSLPYLDQCINETLRIYPMFNSENRVCNKEIKYGEITIEPGTIVRITNFAMDHDSKNHPAPYEFNPDRFSPRERAERHESLFLPFGNGPRACPGRFIVPMLLKHGLSHLLANFAFRPAAETVDPLQLVGGMNSSASVKHKMFLRVDEINNNTKN